MDYSFGLDFRPERDNSAGTIHMHGYRIIFVDIFVQDITFKVWTILKLPMHMMMVQRILIFRTISKLF